jgi:hypothetical protein
MSASAFDATASASRIEGVISGVGSPRAAGCLTIHIRHDRLGLVERVPHPCQGGLHPAFSIAVSATLRACVDHTLRLSDCLCGDVADGFRPSWYMNVSEEER